MAPKGFVDIELARFFGHREWESQSLWFKGKTQKFGFFRFRVSTHRGKQNISKHILHTIVLLERY